MTLEQAIEKAIEGGFIEPERTAITGTIASARALQEAYKYRVVCNSLFWQSLGKAMGWEEVDITDSLDIPRWLFNWHALIDHLAKGKDIESYFKTL